MSKPNYMSTCAHITRPPHVLTINDDLVKAITNEYSTLPLFEKTLFEYNYVKYYSLQTNDFLKCRWRSYVKHFADREFAPFKFVDIRDFHFYNSRNRLIPVESIHTKTDFRHKLKPGPGVDFCGQMPIPQELLMKRGDQKNKNKGRHSSQDKKNQQKMNVEKPLRKDSVAKK